MHGGAGLLCDRLGHECGKAIMFKRCFTDQAFEVKHLIG